MSTSSPSFLKQRYLNERREFYLEKERIRVYVKDANGEVEAFVRYPDLTTETRRISERDGRLYNITIQPQEELARFEWLLNQGIISKPEFEDMKAELFGPGPVAE